MTAMVTMNEFGQIHLPESVRRVCGMDPGVRVQVEVTEGHIVIVKDVPVLSTRGGKTNFTTVNEHNLSADLNV